MGLENQQINQDLMNRIEALLPYENETTAPIDETAETDESDVSASSSQDEDPGETLGMSEADLAAESENEDTVDEDLDESQEDGERTVEEPEPLDAQGLAEKLDMSIEDIYAIKFNTGEGDPLTLGELKDAGTRVRTLVEDTEQLDAARVNHTNDTMRARAEIQQIVSLLPEIPDELIRLAQHQYQQVSERERVNLVKAIPAFRDPSVEAERKAGMLDTVSQYGFNEVELNHMIDHRLVKLIDDFTRLRQKLVAPVKDIRLRKKGNKSNAQRVSKKRLSKQEQRQTRANEMFSSGNKFGAIDILLGD